MLEQMKVALETAQTELAGADIALMEATALQQAAFDTAMRLEAAVAALGGAKTPAAEHSAPQVVSDGSVSGDYVEVPNTGTGTAGIHDLTPEEFDAERLRKQRKRDKERKAEALANNPLAHLKCSGCGRVGTMQDTMMQAPSGATVRMMVCFKCNNQIMS